MIKKNPIVEEDLNYIYSQHINKSYYSGKRILITGASGFLGYYLSRYLVKFKKKLKIKKLFLTSLNISELKKLNLNEVSVKKFDVVNDSLSKFNIKFDIIIHAASIASPVEYRKNPILTMKSNVLGLWNILEYCKNRKTKVFFFSSSEVYGDPLKSEIPTKETYLGNVNCLGPRACYDEAKRFSETMCLEYSKKYKKLKIVIVRPFNNFGPGMKTSDKRLPADLAKQVLQKKNIVLYSDGKPQRTFCYISDAIIGYVNALSYNKFDVFNIGSIEELSTKEFAKLFVKASQKILEYTPKITFKKHKDLNYLKDNPNRRCPDLKKSLRLLKYNPKISAYNGILKYLKFLKYENKY